MVNALSIVVPTYNEAENILKLVDEILAALEDLDVDVEVLVVDDDSPDRTWALVQDTYRHDSHVRVIRRTTERGLGTAVVRGFREANGDVVGVIDADFQHPPGVLPQLLAGLEADGAALAIGSRFVPGGGIDGWTRTRKLISRAGAMVSKLGIPEAWRLSDPMSGLFLCRKSLIEDADLRPDGYKILLEVVAKTNPGRIVEVPYVFRQRAAGESKLDSRESARYLGHVSSLSIGDPDRFRQDVMFFALLALVGVLASEPWVLGVGAIGIGAVRGLELGARTASVEVTVEVPPHA